MRELARLVFLLRADLARLPGQPAPPPGGLPPAWRIVWGLLASRGYLAVVAYRVGRFLRTPRRGRPAKALTSLAAVLFLPFRIFVLFLTKTYITDNLDIGPGLRLSDRGRLILAGRKFGANLTIGPNVTTGQLKASDATPILGDNVVLEGDCVLFGRIAVGDGCVVTAGAVLSRNVPAGMLVRGNPPVFFPLEEPESARLAVGRAHPRPARASSGAGEMDGAGGAGGLGEYGGSGGLDEVGAFGGQGAEAPQSRQSAAAPRPPLSQAEALP